MTRCLVLTAFAALVFSCQPNTAEIRCGRSACATNQRCDAANDVCVLDEPPTLIIDEPRAGALIAGDTLKVAGTVTDDTGPATVELSTDGQTWTAVQVRGKAFSTELALAPEDGAPLQIRVRAHDLHQQATRVEVAVRVDNVAPALSLAPLDPMLNAAWFAGAGQVRGEVADGSGLASLTVDVGDGPVALAPVPGPFAQPWPAPAGEDGVPHALHVVAIDLAGNRSQVDANVTVDVVFPHVGFDVPSNSDILGQAFFRAGGVVRGTMTKGARVVVDLGAGPQPALRSATEWSAVYRVDALDFVPQTLAAIAIDAAGNETRAERTVVVDVVPPRLAFVGALQGAKLNAASFTQGNDVVLDWQVVDGDAQTEVRSAGAIAPRPMHVTTSPLDNPKSYAVTLDAEDRAGNPASAQLGFAVDRVLPTVTARYPANGVRNNGDFGAALEFSEPMVGAAGLTLTPADGTGTWQSPTRYVVSGLPPDTVYAFGAGPVTDAFGNPVVPAPTTSFHTRPAYAASGATLMNDVWKFKAAVDADGVLSILTTSTTTPAAYHWARVNPKTGAVEENRAPWLPTLGFAFNEVGVYAASRANPDLSARRLSAATTERQATIAERRAWTRFDDGVAVTDLGMVGVIPAQALNGEGSGLGEVGYLKYSSTTTTAAYTRTGLAADVSTGMLPTAIAVTPTRFDLVEARGSTLKRRSYSCAPALGGLPADCGFSPVAQWNDVASPESASFATSALCSLYSYDTVAGGRVLRVESSGASCANKVCPAGWSLPYAPGSDVRVAAMPDNTFLIAERIAAGVKLWKMPLDATCQGTPYVRGMVAVPAGAAFEPVSLVDWPGLLYVDSSNALRVEMK